jgi:O-antigen/teichoic acid export membrane protein
MSSKQAMAEAPKNLGSRSTRAAGVGLSGTVAKLILQLAAQLVLLRLVSPSDYGIFAIGALCISFANFLANAGLSAALIQRDRIYEQDVVCAFSWQSLLGAVITGIVYTTAPLLGSLFAKPELTDVMRVLSFVCFLNAASSVSNSLLVRDLQYFAIHRANLISYVTGYGVVGIGLAHFGYGYFALACAWLSQSLLQALLYYIAMPHRIGFSLRHENSGSLIWFGLKAIVTNLTNWWNNSIDKLVVGRAYGSADTGIYSVAYNLIFTPLMQLLSTLQSIAFSASSKLTSDVDYRSVTIGTLMLSTLFFLPAFASLSLASEPIVFIILGDKWVESSAILEILSISFAFISIQGMLTPFIWGKGEVSREMRIQIVIAFAAVALLAMVLDQGLTAIATTALLISSIRLLLVIFGTARAFSIPASSILNALFPGVATTIVLVPLGFSGMAVAKNISGGYVLQTLAISVIYILVFIVSFWVFKKRILAIITPLLGEAFVNRLLGRLHR